ATVRLTCPWRESSSEPGPTRPRSIANVVSAGRMNRSACLSNSHAKRSGGFPDLSAVPNGKIAAAEVPCRVEKPLSALELLIDDLGHFLDGHSPRILGSVHKKGRGRLHLVDVHGALPRVFDAVKQLLIREAGIEALLGEARLLGNRQERRHWLGD